MEEGAPGYGSVQSLAQAFLRFLSYPFETFQQYPIGLQFPSAHIAGVALFLVQQPEDMEGHLQLGQVIYGWQKLAKEQIRQGGSVHLASRETGKTLHRSTKTAT
jgi:hypothetical protein